MLYTNFLYDEPFFRKFDEVHVTPHTEFHQNLFTNFRGEIDEPFFRKFDEVHVTPPY
jgi:hypothetical protein